MTAKKSQATIDDQACKFYLVRHGETDWNKDKILQGQADIALNQKGIRQAQRLARQLEKVAFDCVFSSDLIRAKKTAEIIAKERQLEVQASQSLRERFFGKLQGKRQSELPENMVKKRQQVFKGYDVDIDVERNEEVDQRVLSFFNNIVNSYLGKTVLVVAHSGVIIRMLKRLDFVPHQDCFVYINNLGYVVFDYDGSTFAVDEVVGVEVR